jgi:hypothetical protein
MTEMISFGAGVNSVAMTIMLVEGGWRGPIVFADTGGEHPETYCYMKYFERDFLKPRDLGIVRLSPATHPDLYKDKRIGGESGSTTLEEYCLKWGIIPLLAMRWCSRLFKKMSLDNWCDKHGYALALLGISASEPRRVRDDPATHYPLVERDIHRGECKRIIQRAGLEVPRKSGCFFCPGQRISGWRNLYFEYPDLYERAIALEDNASERAQKWATLDPHGISLRQHIERGWRGQLQFDFSEWLPCACRL